MMTLNCASVCLFPSAISSPPLERAAPVKERDEGSGVKEHGLQNSVALGLNASSPNV